MNATAQYRALVVDDEAIVRQATIRALSRAGFTCEAAADEPRLLTTRLN